MSNKPLAIDLYCGLGGWTSGLLAEGYRVVGFDIERHIYGEARYPTQLVLQDVLTLHGAQFKDAALIVASPPCQAYSYRAMPWKRAKALPPPSNELFEACFRIQREACEAAGRHIPLVVENVRGAQPWVGRARWHFGSFYLWGDVPALMPITSRKGMKGSVGTVNGSGKHREQSSWDRGEKFAGFRFDGSGRSFQSASVESLKGNGGSWFNIGSPGQTETNKNPVHRFASEGIKAGDRNKGRANGSGHQWDTGFDKTLEGVKQRGSGREWFAGEGKISRMTGSKSSARKAASAHIAKIPLVLARHIARAWYPI